jgi:hypothetical protein
MKWLRNERMWTWIEVFFISTIYNISYIVGKSRQTPSTLRIVQNSVRDIESKEQRFN